MIAQLKQSKRDWNPLLCRDDLNWSPGGQSFAVVVDYAHTPDGLENLLTAARKITQGSLICVFGCGGDRDRGKRPKMGNISATIADHSVITSDNPRTEEPDAILADIVEGLPDDAKLRSNSGPSGCHRSCD